MSSTITKYCAIILLVCFVSHYTYWWGFCLFTFVIGLICKSVKEAILVNALGAASSWAGMLIYQYFNGGEILMTRVSNIFGISNVIILILISIIIPIILGGLTGWTGYQFRKNYGK